MITLRKTVALSLIAALAVSCTQERPTAFPDGDGEDLFRISEIQDAEITIRTGSNDTILGGLRDLFGKKTDDARHDSATGTEIVPVVEYQGPKALEPLFKNLRLRARANARYAVALALSQSQLTAYKLVADPSEVTSIESEIALKDQTAIAATHRRIPMAAVPIFVTPIQGIGTVVRRKNDLERETHLLRLEPTTFSAATHVRISAAEQNRQMLAFPDQVESQLFLKTDFAGKARIRLEERPSASKRVDSRQDRLAVTVVTAPGRTGELFEDLRIAGKPGAEYDVVFHVSKGRVSAYKLVTDASELSPVEEQLAQTVPGEIARRTQGLRAVPIFAYSVQDVGRVVRARTDQGEETHLLRLDSSELSRASHLAFSGLSRDRKDIFLAREIAERVYLRDRLDGRILSTTELANEFGLNLVLGEGQNVRSANALQLRLNGDSLNVFEIAQNSQLAPQERAQAQEMRNGRATDYVVACDAAAKAALAAQGREASECVLVLRGKTGVTHVRAETELDLDDEPLPQISLKPEADRAQSRLVKIERGQRLASPEIPVGFEQDIPVAAVKGREFLFRRTLQDSPNGFDYTFPGSAGNLEIVKFHFSEDQVRLVRSDALMKSTGTNAIDREVLMIVPAVYFRKETTDAGGAPLAFPRYLRTSHVDPSAIAFIQWDMNRSPNVSSPMDYYSLGQCFSPAGGSEVSEVDNRLTQGEGGILNFSLTTNLAANPGIDCVGLYSGDYFSQTQANFQFKERVSIKAYERKDGEKPLLDVPYEAQRMLGFGLFTYRRLEPNKNGNTGRIGTEKPLPALWDIRDGKQIHYVLAGLPEKGELRDRLIQATKEVVADLNVAFRKALEGTPMERAKGPKGDVVTLSVQGDEERAQMGDLDKNYLYVVMKKTSSGIIGLGGSHQNPRSGVVEAGSVFMYVGNILSSIESMRLRAEAVAEYKKNMTPAKDEKHDPVSSDDPGTPPPVASAPAGEARVQAKALFSQPEIARFPEIKRLQDSGKRFSLLSDKARSAISPANAAQLFIHDGLQAAIDEGNSLDRRRLSNHIAARFAETLGRRSAPRGMAMPSAAERRALVNQGHRDHAVTTLLDRMRFNNYCLYEADDARAAAMAMNDETAKKSDIDLAIDMFKPTLAHEIGHNVGLRHNFIASFDGANHKFAADEKSKRTYSSVMDYLADDHETYDGLGPQDVAALRAAYAGTIEMDAEFADKYLGGKRLVTLDQYLALAGRVAGVDDWNRLTERVTQGVLPVKRYLFCTDEDVLNTPICNRFDKGTTPLEIVENAIQDYEGYYSLTNFAGDRLRFAWYDVGNYIGRLFGTFMPIRMMVEETIYQAIKGGNPQPFAEAAIRGLFFFHGVVRTPDASPMLAALDETAGRFETLTDAEGKPLVVQRKWLSDIGASSSTARLKVRGIEYDKIISLILLTERRLGFPQYERESIRISYPEFERILTRSTDASKLPTIALLTDVLQDQVGAALGTADGFVGLPQSFAVKVSDGMRLYALLGGILSLDVDGTEAKDNLSTSFRIMSGFGAPEGETVVTAPGSSLASKKELKYWAGEQAVASDQLLGKFDLHAKVAAKQPAVTPLVNRWLKLKVGAVPQDQIVEGETPEAIEKKIDELLADLPEAAGPRKLSDAIPVLNFVIGRATALKQAQGQASDLDLALAAESSRAMVDAAIKDQPALGLILDSLPPGEEIGLETLDQVSGSGTRESQRSQIFSSIRLLNQIFLQIHSEYTSR